jgi:Lar family restriction alleviation protein
MTNQNAPEAGSESSARLDPCPFCGGSARLFTTDGTSHWAVCNQCAAEGPWLETKVAAERAWNRRVICSWHTEYADGNKV